MRVIVIVADTFRRDCLGRLGLKKVFTPALDAFAEEATDFSRAYTGSFPTLPNRADCFTGRFGRPFHAWGPMTAEATTLAERLSKAGVATQLLTDNPHMMKENFYYNRGFVASWWERGQEADIPLTRMDVPVQRVVPDKRSRPVAPPLDDYTVADLQRWANHGKWHYEEDRMMARVERTASEWFQDNAGSDNLFLWLDFFDPHEPWDPPEHYVRKYAGDYDGPPMLQPYYGPASLYSHDELENLRAHYAAEIELTDKYIGRSLRMIRDLGWWDDAAIVFVSDHGMGLGEHDQVGKSNNTPKDEKGWWPLYEEVAHIPLMIKPPGGRAVASSKALVQPVDLHATILDWFGLERPESIDGHSLAPALRGNAEDWPRRAAITAQSQLPEDKEDLRWVSVNDGEWTLLFGGRESAAPMLFHTAEDRGQTQNRFQENREIADRLFAEFADFLNTQKCDRDLVAFYQSRYPS